MRPRAVRQLADYVIDGGRRVFIDWRYFRNGITHSYLHKGD